MAAPLAAGALQDTRTCVLPAVSDGATGAAGAAEAAGAAPGVAMTEPVHADTCRPPERSRFDARAWNSYAAPFASPPTVCAVPEMRPLGTKVQLPLPRVRYCRS